jgi:hypothetical protein
MNFKKAGINDLQLVSTILQTHSVLNRPMLKHTEFSYEHLIMLTSFRARLPFYLRITNCDLKLAAIEAS